MADRLDVLWGVAEIAAYIGRTERATHHLLDRRHLPARKVGGRWVASRDELAAFFTAESPAGAELEPERVG